MGNRKAFVESFLSDLDAILPGHGNESFYIPYFDALTNDQFEQMVQAIEAGELILPLIVPNNGPAKIQVRRNLAIGKKWGHNFFEHLWLTDPVDPKVIIKTPRKYLVVSMYLRRQAQTMEAKMAIPKDDYTIDDLSGQVTGDSKGSGISPPEAQILNRHQLKHTLVEFLKSRGGDATSYRKLENDLLATGQARLADAISLNSEVKGKVTMADLLTAAHIGNNA